MSNERKTGTAKDGHYARLRRAHRDQKTGAVPRPAIKVPAPDLPAGLVRLYGLHTVRAAIDNPARRIRRMLVTRNAAERLGIVDVSTLPFPTETVDPKRIDQLTGSDAVHQGALVEAEPLVAKPLSALRDSRLVLVLDRITDPHNVGAIMRSAVAFGAGAIITTARHSPQESGVLAKSASGALEHIDHIEVRNLAESIATLGHLGFQTIGLDSDGEVALEAGLDGNRIALVLGSEGKGLRQKTRETVDILARLDMPGPIRSLNVSNAAAVALYAVRRFLEAKGG